MAGRTPKPTAVKQASGNPGGRPLNTNEPKPRPSIPACPEWLSVTAKETWARVLRDQAPGVITSADTDIMIAFCEATATYKQAVLDVRRDPSEGGGLTVETERGWVTNPAVNIADKAMSQIRHLGSQLGLTPASRSRISASPADDDNDADNWLQ